MARSTMEEVGLILNTKYDLASKRIYFTFDKKLKRSDITYENIRTILPNGIFHSSSNFSEVYGVSFIDRGTTFPISRIEMVVRDFDSMDYTDLKWHIDDVQLVERKIIYKNPERAMPRCRSGHL